ncbi:MAG: hypothetical protein Q9182_006916 [Xanthomendoza sp. 2 TL-2023]
MSDIIEDFDSAMDDLCRNHRLVRSYYRAIYGSSPTNEDRDRIITHLRKIRDSRRQELKREFLGPSGRIPHGRRAFLYRRLRRDYVSHEVCIRAFRIADNWNSSDEDLSETVPFDNNRNVSDEHNMREWYRGVQREATEDPRFAGYSGSGISEQGESIRYLNHQWRGGAFRFPGDMESLLGSEFDSLPPLEEQLDLGSPISSGSSTDGTDSVMQAAEDPTNANRHSAQVPQEPSEQTSERLRARLDQLDAEFNAPAVQISSIMNMIEENNPQTGPAAAPVTDTSGDPRQSRFRENFSDIGEHSTYGSPSTMSNLDSEREEAGSQAEESAIQQQRSIEGLRGMIRRALQRLIHFMIEGGR